MRHAARQITDVRTTVGRTAHHPAGPAGAPTATRPDPASPRRPASTAPRPGTARVAHGLRRSRLIASGREAATRAVPGLGAVDAGLLGEAGSGLVAVRA